MVRGDTAAQREIGTNAINKLADILGIERSGPSAPTRQQFTSGGGGSVAPSGLQGDGIFVTLNGKKTGADPVMAKVLGGGKKKSGGSNSFGGGDSSFDAAGYNAAMEKYAADKAAFDTRKLGMDAWTPDPGYQFRLDNTNSTIDRYQAAGRVTGGRAIKEAQRYGQDFASNEFGNSLGRLYTLAGFGPVASNTSANAGMNAANQMGQYSLASGNAQAAGYANMNNAIQSGLQNYTTYRTYNDWNKSLSPTTTYNNPTLDAQYAQGWGYGD